MKAVCLLFALAVVPVSAQASAPDRTWNLDSATLTYHMSHPIHEVDGISHAARGKGICQAGVCEFLLAAPVKSFDSGDSNRDLHMLQVTRGAEYPLITVRFRLPEGDVDAPNFDCDLEVNFAGTTAHYTHIPFHQDMAGAEHHITGTIPATLTDFKITAPSFLTVPIRNEIPVKIDTNWH